ncbi:MAG: TetR family transcriptional regulator [Pseudohongiellaceae bacterium]
MAHKPQNRPAGRRTAAAESVREALLGAARQFFLRREFKAVSLREIADAAGVNSAMVNYYFGGKQGLYEAMVDELLSSLQASLDASHERDQITVAEFSTHYSRLLADNPWWPNFVIREVLFSDGPIRERVINRFASVFAPDLLRSLQREIGSGHYRADLDPRLTLLSLMGMTVFPFLARPLLEQVLGMTLDRETAGKLAAHNTQLFLHGALNSAGET